MTGTFAEQRAELVDRYIRSVVSNEHILSAFGQIPRHLFVLDEYQNRAYDDAALPIGHGQTISQPSLVAEMLEYLELTGKEIVLEIGTGSGYQAALLACLAKQVYSVERIPALATEARARLSDLGVANVVVTTANGTLGLPTQGPFDAIIVAASGPVIPQPLLHQLKNGGRIVMPVVEEDGTQRVVVGEKSDKTVAFKQHDFVQFVPLIGKYGVVRS